MKKKLTKVQEAQIYCIKNSHANYISKCWGYIHCGRCGDQIGDQLASSFDTTKMLVIGCKDKPCKVCDPLKKKLSKMDKKIFNRLTKDYDKNNLTQEEILKDIDFT